MSGDIPGRSLTPLKGMGQTEVGTREGAMMRPKIIFKTKFCLLSI